MTEKYAYCSTVPRTFVHDCRFDCIYFSYLFCHCSKELYHSPSPCGAPKMPYNSSTGRKQTFHHAKSLIFLTVRKFTTDGNHNIAQKPEAKFLE